MAATKRPTAEEIEIIRAAVWLGAWAVLAHGKAGEVSPETITRGANKCLQDFSEQFPALAAKPVEIE